MAGEAIYYGTGRRKNAVARVRFVPAPARSRLTAVMVRSTSVAKLS